MAALAAGSLVAGAVVLGVAGPASGYDQENQAPIGNPDLSKACGLDIALVLDESGSVKSYKSDVQRAYRAFTSALKNTGSQLAISEFSTVARLPLTGSANSNYTAVTDATIASTFEPYIASQYNPDGSTNWQDGLRVPRYFLPRPSAQLPHLVVFITDGEPNYIVKDTVSQSDYETKVPLSTRNPQQVQSQSNLNAAADKAVPNANGIKAAGSHILAIAVGSGLNNPGSLDRLIKVSGPQVYSGRPGETFDISTTDVYREPDFSKLEAALREAAFQLCSPSLTVRKLVDLTPDPGTDDAKPGPGFDLTAQAAPTPATWVQPAGATGDTATAVTDANGFAKFQWTTSTPTASRVTVNEQDPGPLVLDPAATECTYRTPDQPNDQPLATSPTSLGFSAMLPKDSIVTCTIVNRAVAAPALELQKHTNGLDADAPPGAQIPAGDPVLWEYIAANTGNVTLNGLTVTDKPGDAGDPVPSVSCPVRTLAPGESVTCSATGTARAGNYANTATATATPSTGGSVSATDPSHYFGPDPAIAIVKRVNGEDANDPTGPLVAVGSIVNWTYLVTNTGNVPLTGVSVTDDQAVAVTCPATTLDPGASITCTASGNAVAGQYTNVGTAVGDYQGQGVQDSDPAHYFGVDASISLEKSTNGVDADSAPGPNVPINGAVEWQYDVTNTGNVDLTGVTVTDDRGVPVTCPKDTLAVGESMTCTASGTAAAGQYQNLGTVTARDPRNTVVTASDPSHYFGTNPGIDIEKATNGQDADVAPGPLLKPGALVTWTYVVTNTGNVPLTGVAVTDNQPAVTVSCPKATLAVGESMTCTASGTAVAGQYENVGIATGTGPTGLTVGDADASHYFGAVPKVDIEKATNGQDADVAPGPLVRVGDPVRWTYVVTNTGNVPLTSITVTDDKGVAVACPKLGSLAPGQAITCTATGTAVAGQYTNLGAVTAADPLGTPVEDEDPSHYFGSAPDIDIEKATNGQDADLAPGPYVPVGGAVMWTYVVTNTGNVPLSGVAVTDDQSVIVTCPRATLAVGESMTCTASGSAIAGQYENLGTATGTGPTGLRVTDSDPSHYFGALPAATIQKFTNGQDADLPYPDPDVPVIPVGAGVQWRYEVTNTGNVALEQVEVTDDRGVEVASCVPLLKKLPPGRTLTCYATGTAEQGPYTNIGSVTAVDLAGTSIGVEPPISDPSHYFGSNSAVDIEKATNGQDADNAPGPYIPVGDPVTWTYMITNTGNTPLTELTVDDTVEGPIGDADCSATLAGPLQPGGVITCTVTGTAQADEYTNSASVVGIDPTGVEVSDNDPSNYFGAAPGILVEKSTNGDDADLPPGPAIPAGDQVDWTYDVTNTGNTRLSSITVTDDKVGAVTCPRTDLGPLESMTCTATGTAVLGQYANTATATGYDIELQEFTDTDPSHYFGYVSSIDLQKSTNGEDADTPTGPFVPVGDAVTWNYVVTNTGNLDILSFTVKDSDPSVVIACPTVERILPSESVTCVASGKAKAGQYENLGTVDALDVLEQPLTDTDLSHYFGAAPAIDVEKATNGEDADQAPGPRIPIGERVTWTYVVKNTGNTPLTALQVTDDKVGLITCPAASLAVGATVTCTATGTAVAGQYTNVATATAQFAGPIPVPLASAATGPLVGAPLSALAAPGTITVSDTDPSHYFGIGPAIDIVKSPDVGEVPMGDPWTFTITVTNTGDVALTGVAVTDPKVPACDRTIGDLAPRQSTTYTCGVVSVEGELLNVASVVGRTRAGIVVTDSDDARVSPVPVDETDTEVGGGQDLAGTGPDLSASALTSLLGILLLLLGLRMSRSARARE